MERKYVIAGIGGQGVVFATKILSRAALLRGEAVIASENHGMSQRGGSVMAHVKIGQASAPLVRRGAADVLVAFDLTEALRSLTYVRPGGSVYFNGRSALDPSVSRRLAELGVQVHAVDADSRARELGVPAAANLVVLGLAAAHPDFGLSAADLEAAVRELGPARAVEGNLRALQAGAEMVPARV